MASIVPVLGDTISTDRTRTLALAHALERVEALAGRTRREPSGEVSAALSDLARRGRLSFDEADGRLLVLYTPSRDALEAVRAEPPAGQGEPGFPKAIHKKQAKAFRASRGALFELPYEDGEGALEVFITDWSPCPVAAAVAVHVDHPCAVGRAAGTPPRFTGRFVRHPLTGDLLPVWTAAWVRPDFGTGAVLVNPAHDQADLDLARRIGLPIRFGLVPEGYDGAPERWLEPPIIRTGVSIRTGPHDGLSVEEARATYLKVLEERGLAREHTDLQAGRWTVAELAPAADGTLAWDAELRRLGAPGDGDARPMAVVDDGLIGAALSAGADEAPRLVAPVAEREGALLALRLLSRDLFDRPLRPAAVDLVQAVQETKVEVPDELLDLVLLVATPPQEVAVAKQQVVDQVERFVRVHHDLLEAAPSDPPGGPGTVDKALTEACRALEQGDPARAFTLAYRVQKRLADDPEAAGASGDLAPYFAVARALGDLPAPGAWDLSRAWAPDRT